MYHPRMGGEKLSYQSVPVGFPGSPPHGRGKVNPTNTTAGGYGITPAWAGKSRRRMTSWGGVLDHPRVGGEKAANFRAVCGPRGSPPRGRGKVPVQRQKRISPRITPAWAGKRQPRRPSNRDRRDHPRVGGEKTWTPCKQCMTLGSPPRRRGKVVQHLVQQLHGGITPA